MNTKSPEKLVLDAWALLAFIQGEEPAASRVMQLIGQAEQKRVLLVMLGPHSHELSGRFIVSTAPLTLPAMNIKLQISSTLKLSFILVAQS